VGRGRKIKQLQKQGQGPFKGLIVNATVSPPQIAARLSGVSARSAWLIKSSATLKTLLSRSQSFR
jgi:hypothetical protein